MDEPKSVSRDEKSSSPKRSNNDSEETSRPVKRMREVDPRGKNNKGRDRKSKNMGRNDYYRSAPAKRVGRGTRDKEDTGKERPIYVTNTFSKEEIESEERRPKRKVAVMIGYSGTGYKGMQLAPDQKTIEGDLFGAFVAAGAISKANADDPKKSSLVRCARTDKGVHAAGNVISLKLIIEDPDIVAKINSHLSPQIRVWGIQRTAAAFSCYTTCDSRWYEYLIPTSAFLPPHPTSWFAKQLEQIATEDDKLDAFKEQQKDVASFWEHVERDQIKPILDRLDLDLRERVEQALFKTDSLPRVSKQAMEDFLADEDQVDIAQNAEEATAPSEEPIKPTAAEESTADAEELQEPKLNAAIQSLRAAYIKAKKAYRIGPDRLQKVKDILAKYEGTHNFHNFTIHKSANDPSAKRFIKSFQINGDPVIINNSEWLSLKVHGQSFMMHQIRKMIAMVALIVRCGTPVERLDEAMGLSIVNIPKAPGLGLLLERPVFDSYNSSKARGADREDIAFSKYEKEMLAFKQTEIYDRIFEEEERESIFHTFFSQIDNFRDPVFLFLSTRGIPAVKDQAHKRIENSYAKAKSNGQTRTSRSPSRKSRSRSPRKSPTGERTLFGTEVAATEPQSTADVDPA